MAATLAATVWMARHQDIAAQAASRQMVAGGLTAFAERTKVTLLDYAIWTDAYDNILAGESTGSRLTSVIPIPSI